MFNLWRPSSTDDKKVFLMESKMQKIFWVFILIAATEILNISYGKVYAGQWSINTGLQLFTGKYIYANSTATYYFSGGIRYKTSKWNVSVNFPFIAQNTVSVTNMGGMFFPNNENEIHGNESHWNMHGGQTNGSLTTHHLRFALGDVYAYGERQIFAEGSALPSLTLTGQVKFPTASVEENFSTGEYDFSVGVALRKLIYPYSLFFDISYFRIGDPVGITYQDPIIFGIGIGKFFWKDRLSALVYYQNYSRVLTNFDPPRQVTLGSYIKISPRLFLSSSVLFGLSNTSPDYGFSTGLELMF